MNRSAEAGLRQRRTQSFSASPVDVDRDGDQDVWIGKHTEGAILWRNDGKGRFSRVTTDAWPAKNSTGLVIDRHDCAWADVDRNGRPDAYCSTGRLLRNVVKRGRSNELWLQSREGGFREVTRQWGARDLCGRGRFVAFLNANGDRWPDLFVGNSTPRRVPDECNRSPSLPNERSKLFINVRGERLSYRPDILSVGAGPGNGCAEVLDYDGDGDDDLLLCGERDERPILFENIRHDHFTRVAMPGLRTPAADAAVIDVDRDGDRDIITASRRSVLLHLNQEGSFGTATVIGRLPAGSAQSVAAGDADRDGDIDVFGVAHAAGGVNPDDYLWLSNGDGQGFARLRAPAAGGTADQVTVLHRGAPGSRDEFLVLNGGFRYGHRYPSGPIQLFRLVLR